MHALSFVLGIPLLGGLALAFFGHRAYARDINVVFSLGTFVAACELTRQVIDNGPQLIWDKQFYIDPLNGQMYSHKDVESYFKRISVPPTTSYFRSMDNKRIIQFLLEELSKCFDDDRNKYKMEELQLLAGLLD